VADRNRFLIHTREEVGQPRPGITPNNAREVRWEGDSWGLHLFSHQCQPGLRNLQLIFSMFRLNPEVALSRWTIAAGTKRRGGRRDDSFESIKRDRWG
jgi:hypothetical protein